jgi:serine kinase of HPr protein (carbohydrate metabolism regulator)
LSAPELVHATTVAIDGRGVLIRGASGSGKSDLALRLIDRGAELVSDDQTVVERVGDVLVASAPKTILGKLEVREVGVLELPSRAEAPVALCVSLEPPFERTPSARSTVLAGVALREIALDPRPASAAIKVELALRNSQMVVE